MLATDMRSRLRRALVAAVVGILASAPATSAPTPPTDESLRAMGLSPTQGVHFIIWSDAQPRVVDAFMESLDRLVEVFEAEAERQGWELSPAEGRHLVLFFESQQGYESARAAFAGDSARGFYSTGRRCGVYFDTRNSKEALEAGAKLHDAQREVSTLLDEAAKARRAGATVRANQLITRARELEKQLDQRLADLNAHFLGTLTSVVTHEGGHQLLFERGVQTSAARYPAWVSEGLAVCFETPTTKESFGPRDRSPVRREAWEAIVRDDRPDLMVAMLSRERPPTEGDGTLQAKFYAQSGALVAWMLEHRRTEFARYLRWFGTEGRGRILTPEEHVEVFEQFFGPVDAVERSWQRYELERIAGTRESRWANDLAQAAVPDPRPALRAQAEKDVTQSAEPVPPPAP